MIYSTTLPGNMEKFPEDISVFKTIFEQTPISTQIFSPDGTTILVNKAWETLWNVKASDIIGKYNVLKDKQLVKTGTMPFIQNGFKGKSVAIPAIEYNPQETINIPNARTRWLSANIYPIKSTSGKIIYIVLQHEDITDQKKADEALKASEERFRTLTSHAPVGIFLTDKYGKCLFVNKRWSKIAGMKKSEALGTGWVKALHPEDSEAVYTAWHEFTEKGGEFNIEYRFKTPQGKVAWVSGSAIALLDQKKNVTGYMGTIIDISIRKRALQSLEDSEERLRLALLAGKIGVWDWDVTSNKLTWTDNVYAIHGVTRKRFEVNFKNFLTLIHPDDKNFVLKSIQKSLESGPEFVVEFRIVTPSGETRWVGTKAHIHRDKKGKPLRMVGSTTDITDQKQLEQQKSDFLSMASHELKTPITSMNMFVDLLIRELNTYPGSKSQYLAKRIKDQTNKLTELTNDLLDVSRIETGKLKLNKEHFDLYDLVFSTVEGIQATTQHSLKIKGKKNYMVVADKYRIFQVLVNLLTNAIKYSPSEKPINVSLKNGSNKITISVQDFGIGIAKKNQDKIFQRLYQITDSEQKTYPGLGLGLHISKEIIERHSGKIWVESNKGKGSTFYFTLPL